MATYSSILARKSYGQRSLVGYSPQRGGRLLSCVLQNVSRRPWCLLTRFQQYSSNWDTHTHTHTHTHKMSLGIAKCHMRGQKRLLLRITTLENLKYSWKFYHILLVKTSHKHSLDSNLMAARRPGSLGATKVTDCHNSVRLTLKFPYYNVKLRLILPEPRSQEVKAPRQEPKSA